MEKPPLSTEPVVVEERKYYFVFALLPTRTIDVQEKCPGGIVSIFEETTFTDGLTPIGLRLY